jgi:hypothetical protein
MQGTFERTLELNDVTPSGPVFATGVSNSRDNGSSEEREWIQKVTCASYDCPSAGRIADRLTEAGLRGVQRPASTAVTKSST